MRIFMAGALALAVSAPAAAQQPTQAQASAIRSSCRGDYQNVCAGVPTGGQAALSCLQQHAASVSPGCQQALAPLGGGGPGAAPPPPMSRPAPPPQMSQRDEMRLLRTSCRYDYRRFCSTVQPGGGRILSCFKAFGPSLSPSCRAALASMQQMR